MTEKYNWELDYEIGDCKLMPNDGRWKEVTSIDEKTGNRAWNHICIVDVPMMSLIKQYELLLIELSEKEVDLSSKKEEYANKEFEIVFMSDVNFKELYGSTSEKVRKQHAKNELSKLDGEIKALEFGINWIRGYIPLLKEAIRSKPYLDKVKTAQAVYDWLQE